MYRLKAVRAGYVSVAVMLSTSILEVGGRILAGTLAILIPFFLIYL
jgi:hypothetical protein